jgi:hypothetical protein
MLKLQRKIKKKVRTMKTAKMNQELFGYSKSKSGDLKIENLDIRQTLRKMIKSKSQSNYSNLKLKIRRQQTKQIFQRMMVSHQKTNCD